MSTTQRQTQDARTTPRDRFAKRVAGTDWDAVTTEVNDYGCALLPQLLTPAECARIAALWDEPKHFRTTVNLRRHRFGDSRPR